MSSSRSPIVRVLPAAVLAIVVVVALVPSVLWALGRDDAAAGLGGDFPAFYGAGRIVLDGDIDRLYDEDVQRSAQAGLHDDADDVLFFAYPPLVAVAYAGIAWLPYGVALTVQVLIGLAALVMACAFLTRELGSQRPISASTAAAVCLASYPIATAVLGGQNTTITVALVAVVWWALRRDLSVAAGLAAAAALYKPQFGILVIAALVVLGAWRALAVALGGAAVLWSATAAIAGWDWVGSWLTQVEAFAARNGDVNGYLMVDIVGWVENLTDARVAVIAAWSAVAIVVVVTGSLIYRHRVAPGVLGVVMAAMVLAAPSALFYDGGIALVGFGLFALAIGWPIAALVLVWAASWAQVGALELGWSPLFVVVAAIWCVVVWVAVRSPESVSQAPGTLARAGRSRE